MKRSIKKEIDDYYKLRDKKGCNFGVFYVSDVEQLKKIATDKGGINFWNILLEAICSSLQAGFMVGYRAGLREAKRKRKDIK